MTAASNASRFWRELLLRTGDYGSGAICEIVNHQGHQGTRRKYLKPKAFVALVVQDFIGSIAKLHYYENCLTRDWRLPVELHYTSAGCPVFSAALSGSEALCLKVCFNRCTCS